MVENISSLAICAAFGTIGSTPIRGLAFGFAVTFTSSLIFFFSLVFFAGRIFVPSKFTGFETDETLESALFPVAPPFLTRFLAFFADEDFLP